MTKIEELKEAIGVLETFVSDRSKFGGETIDEAIENTCKAAQEHIELRENGGWRLIESAPKDGTVIQAIIQVKEHGKTKPSYWQPKLKYAQGHWQANHAHGWFDINMLEWIKKTPTHWQPLPQPPKGE